jgi:ribosomal protein S18 acetylase RimI-like enzyme
MTIDVIYTRSDLVASHRAAVDAVIAERVYLGRLALPPFDPGTAFLLKHLANNWPTYCAVANDDVVGWADITPVDIPECAHRGILGMGVIAPFRGKGLGGGLLAACIAHAPKCNIEKIELSVYTDNAHAIALYRKFGFTDVGIWRDYRRVDGKTQDALLMERRV